MIEFRKSTRSATSVTCVEVGWVQSSRCEACHCVQVSRCDCQRVHIRDSKNPGGPQITVSRRHWQHFLADVKAGHYDLP